MDGPQGVLLDILQETGQHPRPETANSAHNEKPQAKQMTHTKQLVSNSQVSRGTKMEKQGSLKWLTSIGNETGF